MSDASFQNFNVPALRKRKYGEVTTPYVIIDEIFSGIPIEMYGAGMTWLDVGAGYGYFGSRAIERSGVDGARVMFSEINPEHVKNLKQCYGATAVVDGDFLVHQAAYDVIVGNPPYVLEGAKKVPTMAGIDKKKDGKTSWTLFVKHALNILKTGGYLGMVVPCLWMRLDRAGLHELMLANRLVQAKCYDASECSRLFKGKAQTPVVAFVLQKSAPEPTTLLYCGAEKNYVQYHVSDSTVLPTGSASLVRKFLKARDVAGGIRFSKTNMPNKGVVIDPIKGKYRNIKTTVLDGLTPRLITNRSNAPLAWQGVPKLVLGHKMYGLPYIDATGEYGVSSRDNYVITELDHPNMQKMQAFLETRTVRCLFSCFRYRMRYLEREALEHLFDPTCIQSLPDDLDDEDLAEFLQLSTNERRYIHENSGREYKRTSEN